MKRRNFLKRTAPLAAAPFALNSIPYQAFATPKMINSFGSCEGIDDRVLVLVQLEGGNDGLNTVVPLNQYSAYAALRPNIGLPETSLLEINDSGIPANQQVGLHPSLTGLKSIFDNSELNIIQAVGYQDANQSHFKSTDLWLTGGDGTPAQSNYDTGWMGRYLTSVYPGIAGSPTALLPDPLGIQLGSKKPSLGFYSTEESAAAINLSGQDPSGFYSLISEVGGVLPTQTPNTEYGTEMQYIMNVQNSTSTYAQRITDVFDAGTNTVTYPSTRLADQLKTVAKLIAGGCTTKIYLCAQFGYDTHNEQIETSPTQGWHADNLLELSEALKAFQDDLNGLNQANRVLTATFSEFGREVPENGSMGTDHGTIAPMFIMGKAVQAGITGTNPSLNANDLADEGTQWQANQRQFDYRQVYATILQDWLGASNDNLQATYFDSFSKMNLVQSNFVVDPSCYTTASLPIELAYFSAQAVDNQKVMLEWETASEHNNHYFEIERSPNGKDFRPIVRVKATGESDTKKYYLEYDKEPLIGVSYYRLKQMDLNGKATYFPIQSVNIRNKQIENLRLFPNPATYDTQLVVNSTTNYPAQVMIYDLQGHEIRSQVYQVRQGYNKFTLDVSQLSAGNYYVHLQTNNGNTETLPLVITSKN
ncbi:MAG: DUF1501 domain-containing protein [Saprospiraceae bacterium]